MTLVVAIAAENDEYDGLLYRRLLELCLAIPTTPWATDMRFNGYRSVWKLANPFLQRAWADGVRHAVFAVDNDGGAKKRIEHDAAHIQSVEAALPDGCRHCWMTDAVPTWWRRDGGRQCVAVPVQTLETWLLHLRGDDLQPTPEQAFGYNRDVIKRKFFGAPRPPASERQRMAVSMLERPDALERLRTRSSFRLFESQLRDWL